MKISNKKYRCGLCDRDYYDESEAIACWEDCLRIQSPEIIEINTTFIYRCDFCNSVFGKIEDCSNCEKECKFVQAGQHPQQEKLHFQ